MKSPTPTRGKGAGSSSKEEKNSPSARKSPRNPGKSALETPSDQAGKQRQKPTSKTAPRPSRLGPVDEVATDVRKGPASLPQKRRADSGGKSLLGPKRLLGTPKPTPLSEGTMASQPPSSARTAPPTTTVAEVRRHRRCCRRRRRRFCVRAQLFRYLLPLPRYYYILCRRTS